MCANVFFAPHPPTPPPMSLDSSSVRRRTGDTPRVCSHGVLSIVASCWPQGQPIAATADFSSNAAGASSMLRLSEDQIQRKPGKNNLVQERATQCEIHPCSEAEENGEGERQSPSLLQLLPFHLASTQQSQPQTLCSRMCSSAPLGKEVCTPMQSACCCVCMLWQGEQLRKPHVPMHVLDTSWPRRNSCTQRHQHILCVNAHTICQHVGLYGR